MRVRTLEDTGELLDQMRRTRAAAAAIASQPWAQLALARLIEGACWVSDRRSDHGVIIFGEVQRSSYAEDWPREADSRTRGWVSGSCYSTACVEGEWGATHVNVIDGILSREVFERFRTLGWEVPEADIVAALQPFVRDDDGRPGGVG